MNIAVTSIVLFCITLSISRGDPISTGRTANDIASPIIDPNLCGRSTSSYVCDPDRIISISQADELDKRLAKIRSSTVCHCSAESSSCRTNKHGYIIGIALIKKIKMAASSSSSGNSNHEYAIMLNGRLKEARHISHELISKWSLGHCNDGILVLYSDADNLLYTAVDSGARRFLSDDLVGEISSNARMELSRNMTAGLDKLLTDYKSVFMGTYVRTTNWDNMIDALPVVSKASAVHSNQWTNTVVCMSAVSALYFVYSIVYNMLHPSTSLQY